jgi:hypothetical protein
MDDRSLSDAGCERGPRNIFTKRASIVQAVDIYTDTDMSWVESLKMSCRPSFSQ